MHASPRESHVTSVNYTLGYSFGKVEAFVHPDSITIHVLPRDPPGMLYEVLISRPEGCLIRERSFIPPNGPEFRWPSKDCKNPAELRPNIGTMLNTVPEEIAALIRSAYEL